MSNGLKKIIEIKTPEGVSFPLYPASPMLRAAALMIDFLCILVAINTVVIPIRLISTISKDTADGLIIIVTFLVAFGYYIAIEWFWDGRSVGKKIFHLRVIDQNGLKLSLPQVLLRNLLRFVDTLPIFYIAGGLSAILSQRWQRLGDIAAGTMVIRERKMIEPDLSKILADKYNSFRDYPYFAAKARSSITPDEATLIFDFLQRRDKFNDEVRIKLCSRLADYFRSLVEFPPEAMENISDERYLRNLVDIVYQREAI
ncbi:MAG: RDD family protein [Victivallaceae bacterium]|nr:RDD family protein [Victivallaceae bacterium]